MSFLLCACHDLYDNGKVHRILNQHVTCTIAVVSEQQIGLCLLSMVCDAASIRQFLHSFQNFAFPDFELFEQSS